MSTPASTPAAPPLADPVREKALADYKKKLLEHKEIDARLKTMRDELKSLTKQYDKSENDLKALQSVGQIVGEVLRQLTEDKFIVKATNGPRWGGRGGWLMLGGLGQRCQLPFFVFPGTWSAAAASWTRTS